MGYQEHEQHYEKQILKTRAHHKGAWPLFLNYNRDCLVVAGEIVKWAQTYMIIAIQQGMQQSKAPAASHTHSWMGFAQDDCEFLRIG
jgi:hypothetical protein